MTAALITPPAIEPVLLADAKAYLRLDSDDEDDFINAAISAARVHVETLTRRVLIQQSWRVYLDNWPRTRVVTIPVAPLIAVESVVVYDRSGDPATLSADDYQVDTTTVPGRLTPEEARQAILFAPVAGWVPGAVPVTTTFASAGSSASSASSFTLSISGMLTTGYRIIGVLGRGSSTRTINSVTLDGVAATALSSQISNSGTSGQFFIVAATANATANAVVSLSGAWTACAVGVWNVRNLASTAASDTVGSDTTYSSNQLSASVNVLAGGAVYAIAYDSHNGGPTFTWTGLTEAFDLAPGGSSPTGASGANADFSAAQTGLAVTAQGNSGASVGVLIVVPMR